MNRPPLAGLRVLTVSQFGAGPFGTQVLADLGADVIKIEDPTVGGDIARYVPPFRDGRDSLYFQSFNRGKKSITLDLRRREPRVQRRLRLRDQPGDRPQALRRRERHRRLAVDRRRQGAHDLTHPGVHPAGPRLAATMS